MTGMDFFILMLVGIGVVLGFMKGFIRQLASLLGLIAGLIAAKMLYASLAEKLCPTVTDSMTVAQILAFIMIWVAVPLLFTFVGSILTRTLEAVSLRWLDRWLGAGFGALKYLFLISLAICLIEYFDGHNSLISETKKKESLFYYPMERFAGIFFPVAKDVTKQLISNNDDATRRTQ